MVTKSRRIRKRTEEIEDQQLQIEGELQSDPKSENALVRYNNGYKRALNNIQIPNRTRCIALTSSAMPSFKNKLYSMRMSELTNFLRCVQNGWISD